MASNRGMGRGLAAILPESGVGEPHFREIPVGMIQPNPNQPRKTFDDESLKALARSMADAGVVQPLIVRPLADGRYELIAGERRWRAAGQAGIEHDPAARGAAAYRALARELGEREATLAGTREAA